MAYGPWAGIRTSAGGAAHMSALVEDLQSHDATDDEYEAE